MALLILQALLVGSSRLLSASSQIRTSFSWRAGGHIKSLKCERVVHLPSVVFVGCRLLPRTLQVIVMGAEQNGLPRYYREKLRAIKTNAYDGPLPTMSELEAKNKSQRR